MAWESDGPAGTAAGPNGGVDGRADIPPVEDLTRFWELPLVLMAVGDYDGNFVHLNQAYRNTLGWSWEELRSVPWWEFLHPDERDDLTLAAQRLMHDGSVRLGDTIRMICRDGTYSRIRWNTAADRERGLFYGIGFPIHSSIKPAGRITVGSWTWDVATQTVTCSPELAELIAPRTGRAWTSAAFLDLLHPRDQSRVKLQAIDSLLTGERFSEDVRIQPSDGTVRCIHAAGRAGRDADGHVSRLHGIAFDITPHANSV
jgi:PAS domain S-box-containing protein